MSASVLQAAVKQEVGAIDSPFYTENQPHPRIEGSLRYAPAQAASA